VRRGPQDTSKSAGKSLLEEAYYANNKSLTALPGLELITLLRHPTQLICPCYRAKLRTLGSLCPLRSEGRKEL
jgi:hypothetical protein